MTYSINTTNMSTVTGPVYNSPTYTYATGATAGAVLTTTGMNGSSSWATISADPSLQGTTLKVSGNADISGELTVQGISLSDRLDKIEERLGILRPNEELEEKWSNLRALRNAYKELEAEIIEKEAMWAILKK